VKTWGIVVIMVVILAGASAWSVTRAKRPTHRVECLGPMTPEDNPCYEPPA